MTHEANGEHIPERYRPDALEQVAGSLPAAAAAGALAAFAGTPLAALLPVLTQTLAAGRQQRRIAEALETINQDLETHHARLDALTDQQYQVITGAVSAVFETIDPRKLEYLRKAARNAIDVRDVASQEAVAIARVLRELSADEVRFLIDNFHHERVHVTSLTPEHKMKTLLIHPASQDALVVNGLVSMGLLENGESTYGDSNMLRFSRLVAKLIALLRD